MKNPVLNLKYVATVDPVDEFMLMGTADSEFWIQRLAEYDLTPIETEGRTRLVIAFFRSRYLGMPFTEAIISVDAKANNRDTFFLVAGFQSNRFFAFTERHHFMTPYHHASINIRETNTTSLIEFKSKAAGSLELSIPLTKSPRVDNYDWEGAIHFNHSKQPHHHLVFGARMRAQRKIYTIEKEKLLVDIQPTPASSALHSLTESEFRPTEYSRCPHALHARTATASPSPGS